MNIDNYSFLKNNLFLLSVSVREYLCFHICGILTSMHTYGIKKPPLGTDHFVFLDAGFSLRPGSFQFRQGDLPASPRDHPVSTSPPQPPVLESQA